MEADIAGRAEAFLQTAAWIEAEGAYGMGSAIFRAVVGRLTHDHRSTGLTRYEIAERFVRSVKGAR
jgi:hypothetical protein